MKKYLLLLALVCMLGNRALAEDLTIDFSTFGGSGQPNVSLTWENYNHPVINGQSFPSRFWVQNPNDWRFYGSSTFNQTYLQKKENTNNTKVSIGDMKTGDVVTIWGESGDQGGGCNVTSNNIKNSSSGSTNLQFSSGTPSHTFTMSSDGTLELEFYNQYSGIRKITVQSQQQQQQKAPVFNYDPGFEVYDMFEVKTNNGVSYNPSDAGFTLNGGTAQYVNLSNNANLTLNERIAVNPTSGWTFNRGLQAPGYSIGNTNWYNFSICNLKEGDRVEIFYTGTAPTFSSQGQNGAYNGCSAFKDTSNDGDFNSDEGDQYIYQGMSVEKIDALDRREGTISQDEGHDVYIYTSAVYVITQDGHLDLGIQNGSDTRIVKIKIYSDHQATMVDEYDQPNKTYWAHFDVTGELKAKEHIVPGGLEVHVGNNNEDQHAIVVSSKFGPMSYVNAARRFKIPGIEATDIEGTDKGTYTINFNLTSQLPETGTYYKFIAQEEGDMKVKFQGNSMYYYRYDLAGDAIYYNTDQNHEHNDWRAEFDRANERTYGQASTYYLMEENGNNAPIVRAQVSVDNGKSGEISYKLEKGHVYYLYGVWSEGASLDNPAFTILNPDEVDKEGKVPCYCGVAEVYDIEFCPTKKIHPLAKWVPNGTTADEDLADVTGYTDSDLRVKKMSGNITGCEPYIEGGKLKIKNITFAKDNNDEYKNRGGVILIKVGTASDRYDPVYAFTVAYSADPKYDKENTDGSRGHTWDFSSNSLKGLTWNAPYGVDGAEAEDFGTYYTNFFGGDLSVNTSSLLAREMDYTVGGVQRSDWMFNYRIERADGNNSDPRFLSKYDMEGDNADMIYDTEGIIIEASSNQSCMFNEFKGTDIHSSTTDPDRYIGILPGGTFRIPWLEANDRVIIWMGSGTGSGNEQMVFNITNARDAEYKEISATDNYVAGGSQWNGANNDNNYRGCYHFFAKEKGDMIFKLATEGSSMCKIYKIQIYSGKRIKTNDLVPVGDSPLYLVNKKGDEKTAEGTYSIQYRGKGESIDDPEMAGMTGNLTADTYSLTSLNDDNTTVEFTATANDKFGVFNMRLNDLERNNKYVADFADRNFPIGYYEEMPHPYTWDFTDVNRFNTSYLASENTKYSADDLNIWDAEKNFTWKRDDTDDLLFAPGGQIYADAQMIAESAGMRFTPMNVGSGTIQATNQGLIIKTGIDDDYSENAAARPVTGGAYGNNSEEKKSIWEIPWETSDYHPAPINYDSSIGEDPRIGWKLTIPNLPNLTTAYIRVQTIKDLKPKLTLDFARGYENAAGQYVYDSNGDWKFFKKVIDNGDETKDIIIGVSTTQGGSPEPFSFILNNVIVKKIATSKDIKPAFGPTGYQTESRHREIDHRLTGFFTGEDIEAFYGTLGTNDNGEKVVKLHHLNILDKADPDYSGDGIGGEGEVNWRNSPDMEGMGCILYHKNGVEVTDSKGNKQINRSFSILDGGFHLFVPDMHDMDATVGEDDLGGPDDITSENILWARFYNADVWSWGTRVARTVPGLAEKSGSDINYILSATHYSLKDEEDKGNGYDVGFYHVNPTGAEMPVHSCYMRMSSSTSSLSKIYFAFADDFFEENHGITTKIDDASHLFDDGQMTTDHTDWYNLNGQKLNGKPSSSGMYIKNGKKVIIK